MITQYSRTEMLIGSSAMAKIQNSKVIVFGVGGVGGYVVEALARVGIGRIDIVDNDDISLSNINRQIIALHSTIGKAKVDVMKEHILDINPTIEVNALKCFYLPENSDKFHFSQYDYIIDAIDTVSAKIDLVIQANIKNVPIISAMGTGNKIDPKMFKVEDIFNTKVCPLAKTMRKELKKKGVNKLKVVYSEENPSKSLFCEENLGKRQIPASISFVPSVAGLIIASEVVKDIIKK